MRVTDYKLSVGNELTFSVYLKQGQESKLLLVGDRIQSEIKILNPLGMQEKYIVVSEIDLGILEKNLFKKYDVDFSPTVQGFYTVSIVGEEPDTVLEHGFFGSIKKSYPQHEDKPMLQLMLLFGFLYVVFALLVLGSVKLDRVIENRFHLFRKLCNAVYPKLPTSYFGGLTALFVFYVVSILTGIILGISTGRFELYYFLMPFPALQYFVMLPLGMISSFFGVPYYGENTYFNIIWPYYNFLFTNLLLFVIGTVIQKIIKRVLRISRTIKTD